MSENKKHPNPKPTKDSNTGATSVGTESLNYADLIKSDRKDVFEVQNSMPPPPPLPTNEEDS